MICSSVVIFPKAARSFGEHQRPSEAIRNVHEPDERSIANSTDEIVIIVLFKTKSTSLMDTNSGRLDTVVLMHLQKN